MRRIPHLLDAMCKPCIIWRDIVHRCVGLGGAFRLLATEAEITYGSNEQDSADDTRNGSGHAQCGSGLLRGY